MEKQKDIFIYRGTFSEGGCYKIIKDLINSLDAEQKYNLYLISFVHINFDFSNFLIENNIFLNEIVIPKDFYWRRLATLSLKKLIESKKDPILISYLDFNTNDFFSICSAFFDKRIYWINFFTNHPSVISQWFKRKNSNSGISQENFYRAVDCIRLENPSFSKFIPEDLKHKILSFYNTVSIPNYKTINFENKYNILSINGLREKRKSIIPFVKELENLINSGLDFKLHIIGEKGSEENVFNRLLKEKPILSNYINILDPIPNIHDYIHSCDLMVTTATFEGTSNAVLESFAHNTPVLCLSDALGLNETVVHNQNGLLCKNAKEMSESVKSLLLQPDFLKKLSNGCEMIKEQILDENLGVKKYLNVINELSFDHDQLHRNDLAKVSKKVLDQPGSYRESLDAVVCYINLEDFNKKHLQSFFNTQACLEADKIFFIYISKNEKTTLDFEKFLSNYNKCEILCNLNSISKEVLKFTTTENSQAAFIHLSTSKSIKDLFADLRLENICFFDFKFNRIFFLNQVDRMLKRMNSWKQKDNWIWLMGSQKSLGNSCYLNFEAFSNFDWESFANNLQSSNSSQVTINSNFKNLDSLPNFIMEKTRTLY